MPWTLSEKSKTARTSADTAVAPPDATQRRRGVHVKRRMTPDHLPLWRDVLTLQQQLRPAALETMRAAERPAHPFRAAFSLLATLIAIVIWSVQLQYAQSLREAAKLSDVSSKSTSFMKSLSLEGIALAWAPITGALAAGVVLYVVFLLVPNSRRFVRRHPVVPVAIGATLTLLVVQLAA